MPFSALSSRLLALAAISAALSPLAAETSKEWAQAQDDRRLKELQAPTHNERGSSSSSVGGVRSESDEERQARMVAEAAQQEAEAKHRQELLDHDKRVAAENAEVDRIHEQNERERVQKLQSEDARLRERYVIWTEIMDHARAVYAKHAPDTPQSQEATRRLVKLSNEHSPEAIGMHGWLQVEGLRVPSDPMEGRKKLRIAIDHGGGLVSMCHYATCLAEGLGGPADELAGRAWYRATIACKAEDHIEARFQLARMEEAGRGAKADIGKAIVWYREAAGLGDDRARLRLAQMQRDGIGMPADPVAAAAVFKDLLKSANRDVVKSARESSGEVSDPTPAAETPAARPAGMTSR